MFSGLVILVLSCWMMLVYCIGVGLEVILLVVLIGVEEGGVDMVLGGEIVVDGFRRWVCCGMKVYVEDRVGLFLFFG